MKKQTILFIVRIAVGILGLAAITVQLMTSIHTGKNIVNFFSFFTIESNIFAALIYVAIGIYALTAQHPRPLSTLRGGATLYMTITGVVYILLLAGNSEALQLTIPWVNLTLHYILPFVILADWLIFPPSNYVPPRRVALWLLYPLAYLTYSFIRGGIVGWYPYPFINPVIKGWPTVAVTCLFIALGAIIFGLLLSLRTRQYRPKAVM